MGINPIHQKEFKEILDRYSKGTCTAEEQKLVENWYEEIGKGSRLLIDDRQHHEIESRLWSNIAPYGLKESKRTFSYWKVSAVAASFFVIITAIFLFLKPDPLYSVQSDGLASEDFEKQISNEGTSSQLVLLEDGSTVTLEPHSQLLYPNHFERGQREVKLIGAAFFEIAHDTKRPFMVYTKDVVTKVLGTSFTIDAHQKEKAITVSVKTGRVLVCRPTQSGNAQLKDEAILIPNQKAVFDLANNKLITSLADDPQPVLNSTEKNMMKFEEEHVSVILQELEKLYAVEISYDEKILQSCVLTTIFSEENLYDRLKIICKAIGGTYEVQGTKIVLQSHGCN